jgi:hypothetical protein
MCNFVQNDWVGAVFNKAQSCLFSMPNIIDLTQAAELNMHMLVKQFIEC